MKMTIPFAYGVTLRRARHRSDDSTWISSEAEIDLLEVEPDRSEIVHVLGEHRDTVARDSGYGQYHTDKADLPFPLIDGRRCIVREHEGNLYAERGSVEQFLSAARSNEEGVYNPFTGRLKVGGQDICVGHSGHHEVFASREEYTLQKQCTIKTWEPEYERDLEGLHMRAQDFIVIEGCVYEKVREPILVARVSKELVSLQIEQREDPTGQAFKSERQRGIGTYLLRFGIDELHRAIAEAHRLAQIEGLEFACFAEVEHVSPWAVRFRGDQDYLTMQAGELVRAGLSVMGRLRADFGMAIHDLAVHMAEHHRLSPAAIAMARRLVAMKDGIGDVDFRTWPSDIEQINNHLVRLEHALIVWDTRPDGTTDWSERALNGTSLIEGSLRTWEITSLADVDAAALDTGCALDGPARDAADGNGRLFAVEDHGTGTIQGVVFLSELDPENDAPVLFARKQFKDGDRAVALARRYRDEADTGMDVLDRELALLDF